MSLVGAGSNWHELLLKVDAKFAWPYPRSMERPREAETSHQYQELARTCRPPRSRLPRP